MKKIWGAAKASGSAGRNLVETGYSKRSRDSAVAWSAVMVPIYKETANKLKAYMFQKREKKTRE